MAFWSGEKLLVELPHLITPFNSQSVDCAAYQLSIGKEVYVSPTDQTSDANEKTIRRLSTGEAFTVPPGQFAFLMTSETVSVPNNALAFISMRAGTKFRGLVNVSGFHVDPGYQGVLLFAVFNAGPSTVHLKQGDACFLIWYADLNAPSEYVKSGSRMMSIPAEKINSISGELHSLSALASKISMSEKALSERVTVLERENGSLKMMGAAATVLLSIALATLVSFARAQRDQPPGPVLTQTFSQIPIGQAQVAAQQPAPSVPPVPPPLSPAAPALPPPPPSSTPTQQLKP